MEEIRSTAYSIYKDKRQMVGLFQIGTPWETLSNLSQRHPRTAVNSRKFRQRCESHPNDNIYPEVEGLSNQISFWRSDVNLVSIPEREFDIIRNYCKKPNEAVLQRTVMMSIIDTPQLPELFVYNCGSQWDLPKRFQLPSRK